MNVEIIVIGDELLIGQVTDTDCSGAESYRVGGYRDNDS